MPALKRPSVVSREPSAKWVHGWWREPRSRWVQGWRLWAWVVPVVLLVLPLWIAPYLGQGLATLFPSIRAQILAAVTLAAAFGALAVHIGRREPGAPFPTARYAAACSLFATMLVLAPVGGRGVSHPLRALDSAPALVWSTYATYPILLAVYLFATRRHDDRRVVWARERQRDRRIDPAQDPTRFHMQPRLLWWAAVPVVLMYGPTLVGVLT
jgi:hypothetical protein